MGGVEVEEGQAWGEGGDSPISRAQGRTLSSLSLFFFPSTVYPGIPTLNLNQRPTPLRPDPLSVNLVPWSAPTLSYRGSLYSKFPSSLTIIPSPTPYLLPLRITPPLQVWVPDPSDSSLPSLASPSNLFTVVTSP